VASVVRIRPHINPSTSHTVSPTTSISTNVNTAATSKPKSGSLSLPVFHTCDGIDNARVTHGCFSGHLRPVEHHFGYHPQVTFRCQCSYCIIVPNADRDEWDDFLLGHIISRGITKKPSDLSLHQSLNHQIPVRKHQPPPQRTSTALPRPRPCIICSNK